MKPRLKIKSECKGSTWIRC